MTTQFKKFLILLSSGILAWVVVYFFVAAYLSYIGYGNTFGGELVFIVPIIFTMSLLSFYLLLKEQFIKKQTILLEDTQQQTDKPQSKLTKKALLVLVELIIATLLFFGFSLGSLLLTLMLWIAISGVVIKLLKSHVFNMFFFWVGLVAVLYLIYGRVFWLLI